MSESKPSLIPTPSWRRLTAGALATFLAILAVLGARVAAGADPALDAASASAKKATTVTTSHAATSTTQDSGTTSRTSAPADSNPPTTQAS